MTKEKGHWYSSALSVGGVFLASVGGSYVLYKYLSRETFDSSSQLETVSEPYGADRTELLQYIQQSTLKNCTCDELMEVFGSSKDEKLSKNAFRRKFNILLRSGLSNHKVPPKILVDKIATKVFGAFDRNQDGFVDNRELLAGLSILLGSYRNQKLRKTFYLFDLDGDGSISLDEMIAYFTTFFRVSYALDTTFHTRFPRPPEAGGDQKGGGDEETKGKFYSAREVARYTAESCFKAADRDQTGQVSFDEFKVWFNSSSSSDIHEMVSPRSSSRNS